MARKITKRLAAGTSAVAFASVGFIAYAPGAFADATVSYACTPDNPIQDPFDTDVTYTLDAPSETEAGETIDLTVNGEATEVPESPLALDAGDVSRTIPVEVYQDGEHVDTVETTATNSEDIPEGGEVETDPTTGSYTPEEEGTLEFEIGDFETVVDSLLTVTTPCVTEEPAIVHETVVGDDEDDNGDDDAVTTPGRAEFSGTYECVSSDEELLEDFTSGADVVIDTPEGTDFEVGEEIDVTAEGTLHDGPATPVDLAEGDVVGTISLGMSGDAAPADSLELSATNEEPIDAGDVIAGLDSAGTFVAEQGGAVEFAAGDLEISVLDGIVTIDCAWTDEDPGNGDPENGDPENGDPENGDPENGDKDEDADDKAPPEDEADDQLPVTGAALGGLVAAAVAALGGGGAALYLSRKRKAAALES